MRCGAFADEAVVHASQAVPVPDDVPDTSACLIACAVMTGYGAAVRDAGIGPGSTVIVLGAGGVGLNAVQGAALAGAGEVIAVDVSAAKLAAATVFGATLGIDATVTDPVAAVADHTGGGADAVIVTAGSAAAVDQGLACLRRGGTLVWSACRRPASWPGSTRERSPTTASASPAASSARPGPAEDVPRIAALYREGGCGWTSS